jgi:hypothetical protein
MIRGGRSWIILTYHPQQVQYVSKSADTHGPSPSKVNYQLPIDLLQYIMVSIMRNPARR